MNDTSLAVHHAAATTGSSTIGEFCARHHFGRTTYFKMRKEGHGPKELRHGRLVRITAEAEWDWLERMQSQAIARPAA